MAENFNNGCEKRFNHKFWGERICGRFEDLKHSDHYIYCEECSLKTSEKNFGRGKYIILPNSNAYGSSEEKQ